ARPRIYLDLHADKCLLGAEIVAVTLFDLIEEGRKCIENDPKSDLALPVRCKIVFAGENLFTGEEASKRFQAQLAVAAVRKAMPAWRKVRAGDEMPEETLGLLARETASMPVELEKELGRLWTYCDNLSFKMPEEEQSGLLVGYAAIQ